MRGWGLVRLGCGCWSRLFARRVPSPARTGIWWTRRPRAGRGAPRRRQRREVNAAARPGLGGPLDVKTGSMGGSLEAGHILGNRWCCETRREVPNQWHGVSGPVEPYEQALGRWREVDLLFIQGSTGPPGPVRIATASSAPPLLATAWQLQLQQAVSPPFWRRSYRGGFRWVTHMLEWIVNAPAKKRLPPRVAATHFGRQDFVLGHDNTRFGHTVHGAIEILTISMALVISFAILLVGITATIYFDTRKKN
ncbi:hypothetical protein CLV69_1221 [Amycolatopsis arida]|nr:hypothetical protein CLV69_1221 [Amycolatopsis arida]